MSNSEYDPAEFPSEEAPNANRDERDSEQMDETVSIEEGPIEADLASEEEDRKRSPEQLRRSSRRPQRHHVESSEPEEEQASQSDERMQEEDQREEVPVPVTEANETLQNELLLFGNVATGKRSPPKASTM